MQSRNKPKPTAAEAEHIERIKNMACIVCWAPGPSDCHELQQGLWFTSIPLCKSCHQSDHNGIHGRKAIWNVNKMTELTALNATIRELFK